MRQTGLLIGFALLSAPLSASETPHNEGRAPLIGLEGVDTDACPGIGRLAVFEPKKGDFLRVYTDTDERAPIKDRLKFSSLVWLCEADGEWQGIVYPDEENQDLGDCRVSSTLSAPEPYRGPCKFGWIEAKYIELIAG